MSTPVTTTSTKVSAGGGPPTSSVKYDSIMRSSELVDRSLMQDYTFIATVLEVNQQLQCYKLRVGGLPDMIGVPLEPTGEGITLGTKVSSLYGVGTRVLAMTTPNLGVNKAIVLGGISTFLGDTNSFGSPELVVSSPVGSFRDTVSDSGSLNCNFNNFNGGKPIDAYPGDTTLLNSLGCGLFIGALHASLISGMDCSLECHYLDSLVRVNSFNFEHNTAGSETQMFADVGDYTEVKRLNSYVVESLGGVEQYGDLPKSSAVDRGSYPDPTAVTGTYKPQDPAQIGWWRWTELSGYLANLKLNFATVPNLSSVRKSTDTDTQDEVGVFREHVDSTGAYTVVSAKSISLVKDCFIPVPKEHYRPDDSRGDTSDDILQARGDNAQNLKDYSVEGGDADSAHGALMYAASSSDIASFKTHRSTVNFRERKNDWTFREIDEIDLAGFKTAIESSGFVSASNGVSSSRMFAKLPQVGKLKINAREEVQYFASRSMIMMNEDGSIHIQDGYGSTISMRAGCIDISCPGDITLRPGRNLVGMAGDTVSCIAGTDVELSANIGDVRIQADRNVSVLAGNDGAGGVLLETKAEASNLFEEDDQIFEDPNNNSNAFRGIWFKAPGSSVCSVASEIYAGNRSSACSMYLDSGSSFLAVAGQTYVSGSKQALFVTNFENPDAGTNLIVSDSGVAMQTSGGFFLQGSSLLAAGKERDMQVLVKGSAMFSQSVMSRSFSGVNTQIGRILESNLQDYVKTVQSAISDQSDGISEIVQAQQESNDSIKSSVVGKTSSSLNQLTFCYPDSELRGIPEDTSFVMFESDWQQIYRSQGSGAPFAFKGVDSTKQKGAVDKGISNSRSYFWPGASALSAKFGKLNPDSRFVDDKLRFKTTGFDQSVSLGAEPLSFEDNYTIIAANTIRTKG